MDWEDQRHKANIAEFDKTISGLEAELARVQESRREYINRHNLNQSVKDSNGTESTHRNTRAG